MIVSTELDEVIELADRIAVLYKGKLVGIVPAGTGRDVLGLMMAGRVPGGRPGRRRRQALGPIPLEARPGTQPKTPHPAATPQRSNEPGARRPRPCRSPAPAP